MTLFEGEPLVFEDEMDEPSVAPLPEAAVVAEVAGFDLLEDVPGVTSFGDTFRVSGSDAPRSAATGIDIKELGECVSDRDKHHMLLRCAPATNPRFNNVGWIRHYIDIAF